VERRRSQHSGSSTPFLPAVLYHCSTSDSNFSFSLDPGDLNQMDYITQSEEDMKSKE
jgi:hypothetical protein